MTHYRLGVACIASEFPLPGLLPMSSAANALAPVTIHVRRGGPAEPVAEWLDNSISSDAEPDWATVRHLRSADRRWYRIFYDYHGHWADFTMSADGRAVTVDMGEGEDEAEVANLLEGAVLSRALRLAGAPCLHGSALALRGRAVVIIGPSGYGKSSLGWALVRHGCTLVSDDMVGIERQDEGYAALCGRMRLRIWPDAAERMGIAAERDAVLFPTLSEFAKLGVRDVAPPPDGPVPIHAIYRLRRRDPALTEPVIAPLEASAALAELSGNLHGLILPDRATRQRELAWLADIARNVPVLSLTLPDDLDRLGDSAALLADRLFA